MIGQGLTPVVRVDAQGRSHAAWRGWDHARRDGEIFYAYRDVTSPAWSKPVAISTTTTQRMASETFDLAVNDHGGVAIIWGSSPKFSSIGSPYLSWSKDSGKSWSAPELLESSGGKDRVAWVAARFDGSGRLTVGWAMQAADLSGPVRLRVSSPTALGATVVANVVDPDFDNAFYLHLEVADDGRAVLAWSGSGDIEVRTRASNGTWSAETVVSPPNWGFSIVSSPSSVFLPDGSVAVAWHGFQSYHDASPALHGVVVSRWDAGTRTWSRQVIHNIDHDEVFDFEPQLVSNGNRVALLATTPGGSAGDNLLLWRSQDAGKTWGMSVAVAGSATGNPRLALADDGNVAMAWLEEGPRVASRTMPWNGSLSARTVIATSTETYPLKGASPKNVGPSIAVGAGGRATFVWSSSFEVHARTLGRTLAAATPTITGTVRVGKKLTAKPGTWTAGAKLTYQWYANGTTIKGATQRTLVLTAAQRGKRITVKVTGSKADYEPRVTTSAATKAVALGTLTKSRPKITGTVRVGKKLTAKPGTWTAGTKLKYQWYANGKKIKGATKRTLVLTAAQRGRRITVKVTGSKAGYGPRVTTSAATKAVAVGTLTKSRPKIAGKVRVGTKLTAKPGTWTAGTKLTYQWYANGKKIKGATKRTLVLKAAQRGKRITVKVTGSKTGYAKTSTTAAKTVRVR